MMHRLVGSSGPARRVAYALRCAGVARHITMASAARASVSGAGDKVCLFKHGTASTQKVSSTDTGSP